MCLRIDISRPPAGALPNFCTAPLCSIALTMVGSIVGSNEIVIFMKSFLKHLAILTILKA